MVIFSHVQRADMKVHNFNEKETTELYDELFVTIQPKIDLQSSDQGNVMHAHFSHHHEGH